MARPRNPLAKAKVEGRDAHDPGRFKKRKEPVDGSSLGDPPAWLKDSPTNKQRAAWALLKKEIPWLTESHRPLVALAASIYGRLVAEQEVGVQSMNLLRQMLGQMGATPADKSKVVVPDGEEDKDDILD